MLMPFWYRLEGYSFLTGQPHSFIMNLALRFVMALGGTSITIDIARLIERYGHALVRQAIGLCGRRSLEIYALHVFLLGYVPVIVAPTTLSLLVALFLRNVPVLGALLFGEVPRWQRQILRRLLDSAFSSNSNSRGTARRTAELQAQPPPI
jgi:hypothetical protein